jgi:hypothetical protein
VLHPEKYQTHEAPRSVAIPYVPADGRLLNEGVLGEMFVATLVGETEGATAAAGWGGDMYRTFDVSGRTLVIWRSVWDSPEDLAEFLAAARRRMESAGGKTRPRSVFTVHEKRGWQYAVGEWAGGALWVGSDSPDALARALSSLAGARGSEP